MEAVEEVIEGFGGGFRFALGKEFGHAVRGEFDAFWVAGFVQSVGREQDGISGRKLDDVLLILGIRKQAGREPTFSERLAGSVGGVQRKWQACVGESQPVSGRIEDSIQRRTEAAGKRPLQKTMVEKRKDFAG